MYPRQCRQWKQYEIQDNRHFHSAAFYRPAITACCLDLFLASNIHLWQSLYCPLIAEHTETLSHGYIYLNEIIEFRLRTYCVGLTAKQFKAGKHHGQ